MFDKRYTKNCRIYEMLAAAPRHTSFHTPGHKEGKWDITELSFSDNLSQPTGVLKAAQEDIAHILGAASSFILTDGSTSGVLSALYASGVKKLILPVASHKSAYNGCKLFGITPVRYQTSYRGGIPVQPTAEEIKKSLIDSHADGVFITSPDYYGNVADLSAIKSVCCKYGALLLCDGAHGGHLKGTPLYAGNYCDMWVDGVHKSLPAFTQGAVVSAKTSLLSERLGEAVDVFRTTSPNYLIMASVEYAVKYPAAPQIEKAANRLKKELNAYPNEDWTKVLISYGENAARVNGFLESEGIYPEFCDGENIMFYLSPACSVASLKRLKTTLQSLSELQKNIWKTGGMPETNAEKDAFKPVADGKRIKKENELVSVVCAENVAWVDLESCAGRVCAKNAGLFPPCIPVAIEGEKIEAEQAEKLKKAKNTYGLKDGKIAVYKLCEEN